MRVETGRVQEREINIDGWGQRLASTASYREWVMTTSLDWKPLQAKARNFHFNQITQKQMHSMAELLDSSSLAKTIIEIQLWSYKKEKSDKGKWLLFAKKTIVRRTKFYTGWYIKEKHWSSCERELCQTYLLQNSNIND